MPRETPMKSTPFHRITVCVDGSSHAGVALHYSIELAKRFGSELSIVAVAPLIPVYAPTASEPGTAPQAAPFDIEQYRGIVDRAVRTAEAAGVSSVSGICLEGIITDEIIAHIEAHRPDLLVLGSRGLSTAKRLLLGSVSDAVLHHANCPVLVVREAANRPPTGNPKS
jgi:nucleotide-binding universal stress UspA family protein